MNDPPAVTPFGACPVPKSRYDHVLLGHGRGGQLTADLIPHLFLPGFGNDVLAALEDQATVEWPPHPPGPPPRSGEGGESRVAVDGEGGAHRTGSCSPSPLR